MFYQGAEVLQCEVLLFELWDKDLLTRNDFISSGTLSLLDVAKAYKSNKLAPSKQEVKLLRKDSTNCGFLVVRIQYDRFELLSEVDAFVRTHEKLVKPNEAKVDASKSKQSQNGPTAAQSSTKNRRSFWADKQVMLG